MSCMDNVTQDFHILTKYVNKKIKLICRISQYCLNFRLFLKITLRVIA